MATNRISSKQVSPATTFYLDADVIQTDTANRRWKIRYYLRAINGPGGNSSSQYGGSGAQIGKGNNNEFGRHSGNPFLPGGYGDLASRWSNGPWDRWVNANANGYWAGTSTTYPLQMQLSYGSVNTTLSGSITLPRIGGVPAKPLKPEFKSAGAQAIFFTIFGPANNGSPITTYRLQAARNSTFTTGLVAWSSGASNQVASGLRPDTDYWIRYQAVNAFGAGPFSDALQARTLAMRRRAWAWCRAWTARRPPRMHRRRAACPA